LVGGDDLAPLEKHNLAIASESLAIARKTYWLTLCGFLAALAAAIFVGSQVKIMSYQTQIMGSQSESAAAGAALDELNMRRQLAIAQQQAQAAQESAAAIQRQTLQLERPWVAAEVAIAQPLVFDDRGAVSGVNVTLTNKGHSAAIHTSVWTALVVDGVDDAIAEQKRLCGIPKLAKNKRGDYGRLIFPEQSPLVEPQGLIALPDKVKKGIQKGIDSGWFDRSGKIALYVVVCVDYLDTFDASHHQTRNLFTLAYPEQRGNFAISMGAFDPHRTYGELQLLPSGHGASAD
jgi:hypothetical protein